MNVLVGCEESGVVSAAFRALGHNAWSCDLLPTRGDPKFHIQMDVLKALDLGVPPVPGTNVWDLGIFFPPCTDIAISGARWFRSKGYSRVYSGLLLAQRILDANIPKIVLENQVSLIGSCIRKADQIIHPWMFGHGEVKSTCLWLKGVPLLVPTNIVEGRTARVHRMAPGPNRSRDRSATYQGIADAMAMQWGGDMTLSAIPSGTP